MANLDPRILRVSVEVNGFLRAYEDLYITAQGQKFSSALQGECQIQIGNLRQDVLSSIVTSASPFNTDPRPKLIRVDAGRESTGTSLVYLGQVFRVQESQPPDQILTIRALSAEFQKGNIIAASQPGTTSLSNIARQVASDLGMPLTFEADDRNIANYTYNGSATKQVDRLAELGDIDAFVDNDTLIVKNRDRALSGSIRIIRPNDIVGKPELTDRGLKISYLFDNQTRLGGMLDVTSNRYPQVNGRYLIYKLAYNLTNRDVPFYYTAEARPIMT